MKLSNTWKRRIGVGGSIARRGGFAALVLFSSISGLAEAKRFVFPPPPPPIVEESRSVVNESDRVKAFASDCIESLLSGTITSGTDLSRCYPDGRKYTPAVPGSKIVSDAKPQAIKYGPSNDEVSLYSVKVQVSEQLYPGAPKTPAVYQLTVSAYQHTGLQAIDKISRLQSDPPGAYIALNYPVTVEPRKPDSTEFTPLFTSLSGFATAYLTNAGGLDRFTTANSGITALAAYSEATVTAAQAESEAPENPPDNFELPVHIDVSARRPDYSQETLSYPLTLRASGGSWFVAQIDAMPAVTDLTPTPAPAPASAATP